MLLWDGVGGASLRTCVVCGSLIVKHPDGLERYFVSEAGASLAAALIRPVDTLGVHRKLEYGSRVH